MAAEIEMRMVVYGEEEHVTVTVQEDGDGLDLIEIVHRFEGDAVCLPWITTDMAKALATALQQVAEHVEKKLR